MNAAMTTTDDLGIKPAPGKWNPETHPYRASFVVADSSPGLYGWSTVHRMFATEEGARHWLATHKPGRRVKRRGLDVVQGYTGRGSNWRWKALKV